MIQHGGGSTTSPKGPREITFSILQQQTWGIMGTGKPTSDRKFPSWIKKTTADGTYGYSNFESENIGYSITLRGVSTPYGKVERSGEKGMNLT